MDARTGEVLHSRNADTRLHPASLTKMMTLYIAFEAVQNGELSMDTKVTISQKAASEPPSKLGLRAGQKIALRYLVRAAAVKSANDAATAIGEAISGSEAAFARRMNRTAKALGMTRTTFKNAHGLTESGHLSTARDMTILGRHVLYDYPMYYNLFSRRSTDAGIRAVNNTNSRFLANYKGADGIKTGYTRAAGFNLVASAERGSERIIATVFGGRSTTSRNAQVAELLDLGFSRAPSRVALRKPSKPAYIGGSRIAEAETDTLPAVTTTSQDAVATTGTRAKTIRVASAAVTRSLRPTSRPTTEQDVAPLVAEVKDDIETLLAEVKTAPTAPKPEARPADLVAEAPVQEPADVTVAETVAAVVEAVAAPVVQASAVAPVESAKPMIRPKGVVLAAVAPQEPATPSRKAEVVTRVSTSGGRHWGINVGRYPSKFDAEKVLLKTALAEMSTLDGSLRKVVNRKGGFDANFLGLTRETADLACRRLQARQITCFMIGPD
ncbi:serine hydrolase [Thalassococcus arenae]